jgi:hypothetical protein
LRGTCWAFPGSTESFAPFYQLWEPRVDSPNQMVKRGTACAHPLSSFSLLGKTVSNTGIALA